VVAGGAVVLVGTVVLAHAVDVVLAQTDAVPTPPGPGTNSSTVVQMVIVVVVVLPA
jgi:hypothetical protein